MSATLPNILEWTVLPFRFIAKAWSDSIFKTDLLNNPAGVLQQYIFEVPRTFNFRINVDTLTSRNLTLPYFPPQYSQWSQNDILQKLLVDTNEDISLQFNLPASVMAQAFYDATYKSNLLNNGDSVLNSSGFSTPTGTSFIISENTQTEHYLALPLQPPDWVGLPYDDLLKKLMSMAINGI